MNKMKLVKPMFATLTLCAILSGSLMLAACDGSAASTIDDKAPNTQPASHEGRWETIGFDGCFGCHGVDASGKQASNLATPIPDDHYVDGDKATKEIDSQRTRCINCHVVG